MSGSGMVVLAGFPEGLAGIVGLAGSIVLILMVVALGAFVYKSLTGGIEWPDEKEETDEVTRNRNDDEEWKYS